ncbi:flagellar hook-length control protein FliK [Thermomicrobiaceae bacterium CFH 74404]|uniref:Flagellar hook-length control protein FliK n=1 Tax=Thermalbibacter longus TaxID=2951981 RepID=A0AA42BBD5_9BACT|nr:flagellar hook-length control protein FliK [Thermalbibacter longus]MCM8749714.1 flagellar hook-length control protein FliK [Thermalbibacter longus]
MTTLQPIGGFLAAPPAPASQSTQVASGGLFAFLLALLSERPGGEPGLGTSPGERLPASGPPVLTKDAPPETREPEAVELGLLAWAIVAGLLSGPGAPAQPGSRHARPSPVPAGPSILAVPSTPEPEMGIPIQPMEGALPVGAEIELPEFSPRLWPAGGRVVLPAQGEAPVPARPPTAVAHPARPSLAIAAESTVLPAAGAEASSRASRVEVQGAGLPPEAIRPIAAMVGGGEISPFTGILAGGSEPAPAQVAVSTGPGHHVAQAVAVDSMSSGGEANRSSGSGDDVPAAKAVAAAFSFERVMPSETAHPPELRPARHREGAPVAEAPGGTAHAPGLGIDRAADQTASVLDAASGEPALPGREPQAIVPQLAHQIRFILRNGLSQAWVRLDPPSLGMVDVRLTESGGVLQVVLASASPAVRDLLERGSDGLRRELAASGLQVQRIQVTGPLGAAESSGTSGHLATAGHEGGWGQPAGRQPEQAWQAPQPYPREAQPEIDADPAQPARHRGRSDSRIDYWA